MLTTRIYHARILLLLTYVDHCTIIICLLLHLLRLCYWWLHYVLYLLDRVLDVSLKLDSLHAFVHGVSVSLGHSQVCHVAQLAGEARVQMGGDGLESLDFLGVLRQLLLQLSFVNESF